LLLLHELELEQLQFAPLLPPFERFCGQVGSEKVNAAASERVPRLHVVEAFFFQHPHQNFKAALVRCGHERCGDLRNVIWKKKRDDDEMIY
jgi:hypothetical protein